MKKYDTKGKLRPFPDREFETEMTDRQISEELILSNRNQELNSIKLLKTMKAILLWVQIFGFATVISIIVFVVIYFLS